MLWKIVIYNGLGKRVMYRIYETERGFLKARDYYEQWYHKSQAAAMNPVRQRHRVNCFVINDNWERVP